MAVAWFKGCRKPEMPDKMHHNASRRGTENRSPFGRVRRRKLSPFSTHVWVWLVPVTPGPAALLRKPAGFCYGIGAGCRYTPLLRTIGSCYFQSSSIIPLSPFKGIHLSIGQATILRAPGNARRYCTTVKARNCCVPCSTCLSSSRCTAKITPGFCTMLS